ncbi:MAG: hypothetical protein H7Z75_00190 [Ferruginibacter sp.]|nr:hypothetical protein [Cytophagales bacterium]
MGKGKLLGWLVGGLIGLLSLTSPAAWAQQTDTTRTNGMRAKDIATQNDILKGDQKALHPKDRQFYQNLKRFFSKTKFLRGVYDLLFRELPPPSNIPEPPARAQPAVVVKTTAPNQQYDGKAIGKISIQRISVFGPKVNDTLRLPQNWFERAGNRLHFNTRRHVIRNNYLLFEEGNRFDYQVISNNERILRTVSPNLLDARILVQPRRDDPDTVDLLVVTQDVWSISADGSVGSFNSGDLRLEDKNLFGLGHDFRTGFRFDRNRSQRWGHRSRYTIPYLGRTFISAEAEYVNEWDNDSYALRLRKPFLAPSIKYAGGMEVSRNKLLIPVLQPVDSLESSRLIPLDYKLGDLWIGRAFRFYSGSENFQKSARLVLSGRVIRYAFTQSPEVKPDSNQYQDRTTGLLTVGLSRRNYFRDVYIYGFGRTEDVPYGSLVTLTGGLEKTEFLGNRAYGGVSLAYAQYLLGMGYFYGSADLGTYLRNGNGEQGVVRFRTRYFSPLMNVKPFQVRQFVNVTYMHGFHRFFNEGIDINNNNGLRGISNDALRGTKSLVLNLETVLFAPGNLLGFRLAFFAYADLGWVTRQGNPLWNSTLYQGYGLGIRVRNENLAFNTFQFRLGYYPNVPNNRAPFRTQFSGVPSLRLTDLAVGAPEIIPFR